MMLELTSVSEVHGVVAKVLQECQNGLAGRAITVTFPGVADRGAALRAAVEAAGEHAAEVGASARRHRTGIDLTVPLAFVTVAVDADRLVIAGHHRSGEDGARQAVPLPTTTGTTGTTDQPAELDDQSAELWDTADWILGLEPRRVSPADGDRLRALLDGDSRLLATAAADALNAAGDPAVPRFVVEHRPDEVLGAAQPSDRRFSQSWESRVSVDEYALFEATHPAYAAQMIMLGRMVRAHSAGTPDRILDVGSGPGLPTVMLAELFPHSKIDAVEPSPAAYPYLCHNVAGWPIRPHHAGIEEFTGDGGYPLVVSVGTSHHLDTRVFLRSLARLVDRNGLVMVADELIGAFETEEERSSNIARHHMVYIDEALAHVQADRLPQVESARLRALRKASSLPPDALAGLLAEVRRDRPVHVGAAGGWQRVRFAVLELEALVAGIAYDVERKTYPANFVRMARAEGLELVDHRRVYGTVGTRPGDAGTHLFVLRPADPA
ncbi:class I SAM-dependent methyltransferase [Actinomadura sp. KC216]|uniref:class I SAM-dependent methyltransferase n=1 Tax=Actinomadura sp. KC216 TaxID=2530370 RepID=UPI00104A56CF|nr:class I SAM-dependent methyltransferase [Actinomadura sp. KC216]TDB90342.1 class I SAM-dependent methyltransferase [Actinomadura sp. KC216]